MRVTQQDIARLAKVSQATVSRVLSGDTRVEAELRDRVLDAMAQKNYYIDSRAQSLRSKQAHLVGLVLKRPAGGLNEDPFFARLVSEITEVLSGTQFHLCLDIAHSAREQATIYEELLRTRRVDGLIMVEPENSDPRLAQLQKDRFPFVVIGNPGSVPVNSVDNDNVLAGRMATLHLLDNGFHNIGFLAGPAGIQVSDDRITGYSFAMRERGEIEAVWHSEFGLPAAERVAEDILSQKVRPRALVVMDDFMAVGVTMVARRLGLRIPEDLALVSFNNTSLCSFLDGGLTSIDLNVEQIVHKACQMLVNQIQEPERTEVTRHIVPCELRVRRSSYRGDF